MKSLLLTGAAQGIGLSTARLFAARGWHVYGLDVNAEKLSDAAREAKFEPVVCDLADPQAIEDVAAGLTTLDALVNNAAISANGDPLALSVAVWKRVLDVNLTAPFLLSRACAPLLATSKGCIINIASTRALMSEPFTEAYSASKGGVLSLTHALSMSLAPVRVNAISPGWIEHADPASLRDIDHAFHPAGRVGKAVDIAEMVWFLTSEGAQFITGQNFIVDGGVTRKMIYPE